MSSHRLDCFKAYDIRGRVPDQLDEALAERIGRAFAAVVKPAQVVIGHDIRLSSEALTEALTRGLTKSGVDVIQIGLCGTEEIYFATSHLGVQGGIMVTASHNPRDYNGMKLVREGSRPISGDSGLREIEAVAATGGLPDAAATGRVERRAVRDAYVEHVLGYVDRERLGRPKIVANAGNGCAGPVVRALAAQLPIELVELHFDPDGSFPNGIPNPLLPENRPVTARAVLAEGAALGVAWDGDFDRCFFFDEQGAFVEGYYIVGLLATQILARHPGAKIIYDPRLTWNTEELVRQAGGIPVRCKSGHAFIKERMRTEDAVYGGEMSAHHYFREFAYCDSGMIPWLLVAQAMGVTGASLSALVGDRMRAFPASGEINRRVEDASAAIGEIRARYADEATEIDELDGVSMAFGDRWRLNLRRSNTEPLIRLNVEARADEALMRDKTGEILALLERFGAEEA